MTMEEMAQTILDLQEALRELVDFSLDNTHWRMIDRSHEARERAYELLSKLEKRK